MLMRLSVKKHNTTFLMPFVFMLSGMYIALFQCVLHYWISVRMSHTCEHFKSSKIRLCSYSGFCPGAWAWCVYVWSPWAESADSRQHWVLLTGQPSCGRTGRVSVFKGLIIKWERQTSKQTYLKKRVRKNSVCWDYITSIYRGSLFFRLEILRTRRGCIVITVGHDVLEERYPQMRKN